MTAPGQARADGPWPNPAEPEVELATGPQGHDAPAPPSFERVRILPAPQRCALALTGD